MSSLDDAINMPACVRPAEGEYELFYVESLNPALGGTVDAFERGTPRWTFSLTAGGFRTERELQLWRTWFVKLRGSQKTFRAWDPRAQRPLDWLESTDTGAPRADSTTVTADSTAFTADQTFGGWGGPRLTAVDESGRTISLSDFSANATVKEGDPISWNDGTNLRRVVAAEDRTADASGVISALKVEPAPVAPSGFPVNANMYRAACEMRVDPSSVRVPLNYRTNGQVSFSAFQIIRSI